MTTDAQSGARSVDGWETLGKAVLPVSLASYLFGFLVAVPHFAKAGVPIDSISPQRFVAAGLLFLVVTVSTGYCGMTLAIVMSWKKPGWKNHIYAWGGFGLPLALVVLIQGGLWGIAYVVYVGYLTAARPDDLSFSLRREELAQSVLSGMRVLALGLTPVGFFASLVYPAVAVQFGGGRPQVLLAIDSGQTPVGSQDTWAMSPCRGTPLPAPSCRTIYRVHDDSSHLYIGVVERPGTCPPEPAEWEPARFGTRRAGCFQRMSNADVPRLETAGHP